MRGYLRGHCVAVRMPVRLVCAIVAGVAVRVYCGRARVCAAGVDGVRAWIVRPVCQLARVVSVRGLWPVRVAALSGTVTI